MWNMYYTLKLNYYNLLFTFFIILVFSFEVGLANIK